MSHISRSTLIVAVFFGLEKILGFARQVLIARQFGLSPQLDAFNAANNIPDLLFALISGGALGLAFIPVLSEFIQKGGKEAAWNLFSRIANLVFIVTGGISIIVAIFAGPLVRWRLGVAPGFSPAQQELVVQLMRLNLVATLIFSLGGLIIAGLQANQHFWLPAIAPSMYDIGMLIGVLILAPQQGYSLGPITLPALGLGIYGLIYGVILGAVMFLVVQIPGLIRYHFHWIAAINIHHPGVQQVLALMGPRVLTMFFIQLIFLAQDNFASRLSAGAVTALVYGWLFMQVPETLIGTAIGTALLPTLSEQYARHEQAEFRQSLNRSMRVILALTLPAATLLAIVIRPVVEILGFDPAGTNIVVWTTRAYLLGLMGQTLIEVASRAFYAQQNARIPLLASAFTITSFVILGFLFYRPLGAPGIALANSLAFSGEAVLLWLLLSRRFEGLLQMGSTLSRAIPISMGSALAVFVLMRLPLPDLPLAVVALSIGALAVLPFIWPEVKMLVKL